ncbi:SEC10/PgrA surface exclusion domain-containing protein [Streptococcus himalayensis]|uniref:Surface exclusion protein PrgA n=1 Tax=Streptococcus himalayensis TaxID=1888195 RepID=A0A917A5H0_9STRE|nr:SEC10/PgrA surface exclusion domain-containing protein [Streptococcus himalayensis]GGE28457.1 surface exclusion protein PrgA [Streptococcus himalayensis]
MQNKQQFKTASLLAAATLAATIATQEVKADTAQAATQPTQKANQENLTAAVQEQEQVVSDLTAKEATAVAEKEAAQEAFAAATAAKENATAENIQEVEDHLAANAVDTKANALDVESAHIEVADLKADQEAAETNLKTAESAKADADKAVDAAKEKVETAEKNLDPATENEKTAAVKTAESDLAKAASDLTTAEKAYDLAVRANEDAAKLIAEKTSALDAAKVETKSATAELNTAKATLDAATLTATAAEKEVVDLKADNGFSEPKIKLSKYFKEDFETWSKDKTSQIWRDSLASQGVKTMGLSTPNISLAEKNEPVNKFDLTKAQKIKINHYAASFINQVREQMGITQKVYVSDRAMQLVDNIKKEYVAMGIDPRGHNVEAIKRAAAKSGVFDTGNYYENLAIGHYGAYPEDGDTYEEIAPKNMYDMLMNVYNNMNLFMFRDAIANHGHLESLLFGGDQIALDFSTNIISGSPIARTKSGDYRVVRTHLVNLDWKYFTEGGPIEIPNPNDPAAHAAKLAAAEEKLTTALAEKTAAETAYTQATAKVATATAAQEKAEADLTAAQNANTDTTVAASNLKLAQMVKNTADRKLADAKAELAAVTAGKADKEAALEAAKAELATAFATSYAAETKVADAEKLVADIKAQIETKQARVQKFEALQAKLAQEKADLEAELASYHNADANLAAAKEKLATAENKLAEVSKELAAEQEKLAALKAKAAIAAENNLVITEDEHGNIHAVLNQNLTNEKPSLDVASLQEKILKEQAQGQPKAFYGKAPLLQTSTHSSKVGAAQASVQSNYSRMAKHHSLPKTGMISSLWTIFGLLGFAANLQAGRKYKRG